MKKTKKNKQRKPALQNSYMESFRYIKETKNFIYLTIGIFCLFVLAGFFLPVPLGLEQTITSFIERLLSETEGFSQSQMISYIFFNNFQSSFMGVALGTLFGVFPMISALANGYILGFVASRITEGNGPLILWRILPHGIFELPALFISLGMGARLGTFIFKKNKAETFRYNLLNSIKTFFLVVVPLLIIAAIIEGSLIVLLG